MSPCFILATRLFYRSSRVLELLRFCELLVTCRAGKSSIRRIGGSDFQTKANKKQEGRAYAVYWMPSRYFYVDAISMLMRRSHLATHAEESSRYLCVVGISLFYEDGISIYTVMSSLLIGRCHLATHAEMPCLCSCGDAISLLMPRCHISAHA